MVIADNGSTDESKLVVQEWANLADMIRLIDVSKVKGPGAARNAGVRIAQGELLAFVMPTISCNQAGRPATSWPWPRPMSLPASSTSGRSMGSAPSPPTPVILPDAISQFGFLPAGGSGTWLFAGRPSRTSAVSQKR